jgi:chemotaxis protein MotB
LTAGAVNLIEQVAGVLKDLNYRIQVNGFTDNAQIHSAQFSSNWDLSAARAISVVKRFVADGIDPSLLVGAGYGEYHPVASNDTPQGMATNRRVAIVVVSPAGGQDLLQTPLVEDAKERGVGIPDGGPPAGEAPVAPVQDPQPPPDGCGDVGSDGSRC